MKEESGDASWIGRQGVTPNHLIQHTTGSIMMALTLVSDSEEPLYVKALSRNTDKRFLMNFQQLKPQCCDVFIWVAVFRDEIVLWIINSNEVFNNPLFSKGQHRGNKGNEGQLHIKHDNIHILDAYELEGDNLEVAIREAESRK